MNTLNGKLWSKVLDDVIEIRSLTNADLEKALDVLDHSFFQKESVTIACQINLPQNYQARLELRELCRLTAADGVSIIAKHVETGDIVGVAFNKIQYVPEGGEPPFFIKFRNEYVKTSQARELMDFMITVDSENDVLEQYKMESVCELMFLATLPEWENKKIGRALAAATIEQTRKLSKGQGLENVHPKLINYRPRAVTAIFTSLFSQRIGHALGFKVINSVPYNKFQYNGKTYDQRINPLHKACEHVIFVL